jgi:hypothetical protein
MNCGECVFYEWFDYTDDENDGLGICHRYPPVLLKKNKSENESGWDMPTVVSSNWCGEWKHKDAKGR